jgi:hypothetical protein
VLSLIKFFLRCGFPVNLDFVPITNLRMQVGDVSQSNGIAPACLHFWRSFLSHFGNMRAVDFWVPDVS